MIGALLWGIGASMALAEEAEKPKMSAKDKEIEKLKEQIDRMKNGHNCKHHYFYQQDIKCEFTYCDCINCKDKWELD